MKKIFSVSAIALLTAIPAFADNITNNSMCVVDTLGQSNNESTAGIEAMWSANTYSEPAGQYLLFENGAITQHVTCPAGSWCPGFTDQTFADATMGLNACDPEYPNSDVGNSKYSFCYQNIQMTCSNTNPYQNGHGSAVYANATGAGHNYQDIDTSDALVDISACAITSLNCDTGYRQTGTTGIFTNYVNVRIDWTKSKWKKLANGLNQWLSDLYANGLTDGQFKAVWGDGTYFAGQAVCNTTAPDNFNELLSAVQSGEISVQDTLLLATPKTNVNFNASDTGPYCWCNVNEYQIAGSSVQSVNFPWKIMYVGGMGLGGNNSNQYSADVECGTMCAAMCATNGAKFLLSDLAPTLTCSPNTINLNWYADSTSQTPLTVDTASQTCTYDQPITVPSTNPTKPGYTFAGWTLRQTQNNNNN